MRRPGSFAAVLAILALLFSQLAVSAFACPRIEAVVSAMDMPEGHCEKPQKNVCTKHCEYGAATVNQVSPDAAPDVLALPLPWRADPQPVILPAGDDPVRGHDLRSHSPPPLALFGALRI